MRQLSLQEIKQIELNLLKKFDSFCRENHIRYFLSNGTLLGAIKYKGFIPWDDDIDVFVPREDYNKIVTIFNDDNSYKLYAFERDCKYRFPFAKLCDLSTKKEEKNTDNGVVLGIDIDIFPLDAWSDDLNKAKREAKIINKKMHLLRLTKLVKSDSLNPIKRTIKRIVMIALKVIGSKFFVKSIINISKKNDGSENLYLGCKSWCIYGEREILPAEVFCNVIEVEFEGHMFPAPEGYDVYLKSLYGNYRLDPPTEKQKTHHFFLIYL